MINTNKLKRSSHPVMFFIYLSLLVVLVSGIASALNMQTTYDKLTTIAGEVETTTVSVNSLLNLDGLKFLITSAYDNLVNFLPFGSLLIAAIAFGIALKSGFLKSLCGKITKKIPKFIIVFIFSILCIVSSIDNNVGYVLLIPFGAVLFMSMNRNPVGGVAIAFSSIAAGHGLGLFVTSLDYSLTSYTEASAKLLDGDYTLLQSSNLIFIIVATLLVSAICTFICEKIITRKLGRNLTDEEDEFVLEEVKEKKGLIAALIATLIVLIPIILMIIPVNGDSFFGLLLDKSQDVYSKMLFSSDALLTKNLVGIVSFIFALQGFVFGVVSGTIRKIRDMVNFATDYLKTIGGVFVLVFFAAQLCSLVQESNIGVVVTGMLSNLISISNFSFIPLILLIFIFSIVANILLPGSISKWAIIAPNIMPTVMRANVSPEFAQLIFRAGDSIANIITPLFIYFVIFIGFVEVFIKNKNDFSIRGCYKLIVPYFIGILAVWLVMIISWYVIGLPIGPGIYPSL